MHNTSNVIDQQQNAQCLKTALKRNYAYAQEVECHRRTLRDSMGKTRDGLERKLTGNHRRGKFQINGTRTDKGAKNKTAHSFNILIYFYFKVIFVSLHRKGLEFITKPALNRFHSHS